MINSPSSPTTCNDSWCSDSKPLGQHSSSRGYSERKAHNKNTPGVSPKKRLTSETNTEDADVYNYKEARTVAKKQKLRGGVITLVKSCLGGGIFCAPASYKECGMWAALGLNAFLGIAMGYCLYELTISAQRVYARLGVPTLSYQELVEATIENAPWVRLRRFSRAFRCLVDAIVVLSTLGTCSVYQMMIVRQMKQLVDATPDISRTSTPSIRIYVLMLLLPCLITAMCTNWQHLAPFSIVIPVFIVVITVTTVGYSAYTAETYFWELPGNDSTSALFRFVGVGLFSMNGIVFTLAVEKRLIEPKRFPLVLTIGMFMVTSLVIAVGAFGYWGFGNKSIAPVTCNFTFGDFAVQLKMFLVIMMFISLVLHFWVPSCVVWSYAKVYYNDDHHWIWKRVYRMILILFMTLFTFALPSVNALAGFVGAFYISILYFIIPGVISLIVHWKDPGPGKYCWRIWKCVLLISFGLATFFIASYYSIHRLYVLVNKL